MSKQTEAEKATNTQGATYCAINSYGWAIATNPFEAMGKLDLDYKGTRPKVGSPKFDELTSRVNIYFLPDASKLDHFNKMEPVDFENNICGVPIFLGNNSDYNEKIVQRFIPSVFEAYYNARTKS